MIHKKYVTIFIITLFLITLAPFIYFSPVKIKFTFVGISVGIGCSAIYFINYYLSKLIRKTILKKRAINKKLVSIQLNKYFNSFFVVLILILFAMIEELIFRAYLLNKLLSVLNSYESVVASALIFAFVHFSKTKIVQLTIMGILFAIITIYTNNLLPAIISHATNNVIIFTKYKVLQSKINK